MKPTSLRRVLVIASAISMISLYARSCAFEEPLPVFTNTYGPSNGYAPYVAGRLGVVQSSYFARNLAIAYDWINHRPLSAEEQKQAVSVDNFLLHRDQSDTGNVDPTPKAVQDWIAAREAVYAASNLASMTPSGTSRPVPGEDYEDFDNCLDEAYAHATRTLQARVASYGQKNPEVIEWLRGQDAVFSNCTQKNDTPKPLTSGSVWLQQDRAYQIAAAHFYALEYPEALGGFRSIAADTNSPWSITSRYMMARTLIRQATIPHGQSPLAGLRAAQKELLAMRSEPRMAKMQGSIDDLLDLVNTRLQPEQQSLVLAQRIANPHPRNLRQDLIDLAWISNRPQLGPLHNSQGLAEINGTRQAALGSGKPLNDGANLMLWIAPETKLPVALERWHTTHSNAWLIGSMMRMQPGDPAAGELIAAAQKIQPGDPAYLTASYYRLYLSPRNDDTRQQALAMLASIDQSHDRDLSAHNLFTALVADNAPTLDLWLADAGRKAFYMDPEDDPRNTPNPGVPSAQQVEDVCGNQVPADQVLLFDSDAALALNTQIPLRMLAEAATSKALPENLHYQVAQAAWARAVLLDRPEIAAKMSPLLMACRAAWKSALDAYDHATTTEERHVEGLLALMRFASTSPSVRAGLERREGFATYSDWDNWWCRTIPDNTAPLENAGTNSVNLEQLSKIPWQRFLTPADRAEARVEAEALLKVPAAPAYFEAQALDWSHAHPDDPRNADILGESLRSERNACRYTELVDKTLTRHVFEAIQNKYPKSEWAQKYKTWQ